MESLNVTPALGLVPRAIALALACIAAGIVSIGSAAVVTHGADQPGAQAAQLAGVATAKKEIRFG